MDYQSRWLNSCFGSGSGSAPIIAYFNNGHEPAQYTKSILQYLITDCTVQTIIDGITGEIIYTK